MDTRGTVAGARKATYVYIYKNIVLLLATWLYIYKFKCVSAVSKRKRPLTLLSGAEINRLKGEDGHDRYHRYKKFEKCERSERT